jgi:hypothetical protein
MPEMDEQNKPAVLPPQPGAQRQDVSVKSEPEANTGEPYVSPVEKQDQQNAGKTTGSEVTDGEDA